MAPATAPSTQAWPTLVHSAILLLVSVNHATHRSPCWDMAINQTDRIPVLYWHHQKQTAGSGGHPVDRKGRPLLGVKRGQGRDLSKVTG